MANMSYCRFQNTLTDLLDCYSAHIDLAYDDEEASGLSEDEAAARDRLVRLCARVVMDSHPMYLEALGISGADHLDLDETWRSRLSYANRRADLSGEV